MMQRLERPQVDSVADVETNFLQAPVCIMVVPSARRRVPCYLHQVAPLARARRGGGPARDALNHGATATPVSGHTQVVTVCLGRRRRARAAGV